MAVQKLNLRVMQFLFVATALVLASAWSQKAVAQQAPACVKRADLLAHLSKQYKESQTAVGLADNGSLLEVFSSPDGGTWTVTVTMPNGISCMIASGQQWQAVEKKAELGDGI